jgi:hypothetical protein
LIVHSNEQPYHCCGCDFKSKWKSDVKKHQRMVGHMGPILVGKKAMQKVIENLGLDRTSMVSLYGPNIQVIDNKQCKSNEKLVDEDSLVGESITGHHNGNSVNRRFGKMGLKRKRNEADNEQYEMGEDEEEMCEEEDEFEEEDFEQLNEEEDDEEEIDEDFDYNSGAVNHPHLKGEELENQENPDNSDNMLEEMVGDQEADQEDDNLEIENDDDDDL